MAGTEPGLDVIDLRDVTDRYEEIEEPEEGEEECVTEERERLLSLLDELCGNGGDHDWRGDWYPLLIVRDSYFREFAQEEAESCGLVDAYAKWPARCIDWNQAAEELQQDYSQIDYGGVTYWYR